MATRAQLEQALKHPNVRKMLELISYTEGTRGNGYHTAFGGGRLASLRDHPRYSKSFRETTGRTNKTSAAGKYQFLRDTWDGVARQYGLNDFGPHNQDLGAVALLFSRGAMPSLLKGDFQTAIKKTGKEWASLPSSTYAQGKKSWASVNKFLGGAVGPVSNSASNGGEYQAQQAPPPDPRLSMSAPQLLKTLRQGKDKRSDLQILYELSNNNGLAGREINSLLAQGHGLVDIASQLGLKVPKVETQAPVESVADDLPNFENGFEGFMATLGDSAPEPDEPELPDFKDGFEGFMSTLEQNDIEPTQTGDTWQTQKILSDSTLNVRNEKEPLMLESSWESPS